MAQRDASAPPSSAKSSGTGESVFKSLLDRCARVTQRLGAARQSRDAALGYGREAAKYYEPAVQQLNQLVQFYAASNKQVEQLQGQLDECDGLIKELSTELSHAGDRYYSAEAYLVAVDRAREWEQAFHEKESAATNFRREVGERDQQLALRLIEIVDSVAPLTMADGHGKPSGKPDHASIREETFVNKLLKVLSDTWRIQQLEVAPDMQFDGQTMELSTTVEPTGDAQRGTVAEVLQRGYFYAGTRELLRPAKVIVYGRSR